MSSMVYGHSHDHTPLLWEVGFYRPSSLLDSKGMHATAVSVCAQMMPGGSQEKAVGVRVLKEVEELAVSKLQASQQSASDASCQAAKQFLHEAPYEQVPPRPRPPGV